MTRITLINRRLLLVFACYFLLGAGSDPKYELLPSGSVYLVNNTDHNIRFILEIDGRGTIQELTGGSSMLHHTPDPNNSVLIMRITTGEQTVQYELKPESRYILYWNYDESRFDVGVAQ